MTVAGKTISPDSWLWEAQRRAEEPLHPDLVGYLRDFPEFGGQLLKHPLVFDIPFWPTMAWRVNDQYAAKLAAVAEARETGNWSQFIWLHERPYRPNALLEARKHMREVPRAYWELAAQVWVDSENIHEWGNRARIILGEGTGPKWPGRQYLMDAAERKALRALPEDITIWRGYVQPRGTRRGWSWTTDRERAEWFARRLRRSGEVAMLAEATVSRGDVIAHFLARNEDEIVVNPAARPRVIRGLKTTEVAR